MDCGRISMFKLEVSYKYDLNRRTGAKPSIRWGLHGCKCGSRKLERVKIYPASFTGRRDKSPPCGKQLLLGGD